MEEEDRGDQVSTEIASTGEKAKPGEGNLLNTEYRLYDPRLAQWLTRDPVFQPWESPYWAMAGNPILFSDPEGDTLGTETQTQHVTEFSDGGTTQTNPQALTEQNGNTITVGSNGALTTTGASGMKTDKKTNTSSTKSATVSSVTSSESTLIIHADPQGALSAGKESVSTDKKEISPLPFMENDKRIVCEKTSVQLYIFRYSENICSDCVNPASLGMNWYMYYPGPYNPTTYAGDDTFEPIPLNLAEYPAIGHDRRYNNLRISGPLGLFTSLRATGADWQFVGEELAIGMISQDSETKLKAYGTATVIGAVAAVKTIVILGGVGPFRLKETITRLFHESNIKEDGTLIDNLPDKPHVHDPINKPFPIKK